MITKGKRKETESEPHSSKCNESSKHMKTRKYDDSYLSLGFTSTVVSGTERPQCVLCLNILAMDSMKPSKLKRHLETQHPEHVGKSLEFFKRRLDEYNKQRRAFTKTSTIAASALLASYKVSYRIARCKKAHNIAETLVLPAAIDMVEIMLGEQSANKLRSIPLADNTVGRRISDISDDLCHQLTDALKYSHFGLQVDEATDVVKDAHLITYVRYISANEIKEDLLFCKPIVGRATAVEVFNMIDNFFNEHGISWENCVGLCTDGAQSMAGRHAGLQALVREKAPHASWTHCMLHRQALASGSMNEELGNLLKDVVRVVNYIKNSPLKGRLFAQLCKDFGAEHTALLYYCESRWLSRGKVLQRVYELRNEIATFLCENKNKDGDLFTDDYFIKKLAYMVDIFEKLNQLNQSMQGPHVNIFTQSDKICAFMKKIELWKRNVENHSFDMFPNLQEFLKHTSVLGGNELFAEHLNTLLGKCSFYFKDVDTSDYEWIRNPFGDNSTSTLSTADQEQLIDLSCDGSLKLVFDAGPLEKFWLQVKDEYPSLSTKAIDILLRFATSYLCESGFSSVAVLKTKYRSRLVIEKELRVSISSHSPRFEKLCSEKQAQPSH